VPEEEEVFVVVRVPISRIESDVRKKHSITIPTASIVLEGSHLVFRFGETHAKRLELSEATAEVAGGLPSEPLPVAASAPFMGQSDLAPRLQVRRRRKSTRNRMKTRGWGIVTKMANSKGQTVTIYEPFVEALRGKKLARREAEAVVARILKDNGNRPGRVSIDYYLTNTIEYLSKEGLL